MLADKKFVVITHNKTPPYLLLKSIAYICDFFNFIILNIFNDYENEHYFYLHKKEYVI